MKMFRSIATTVSLAFFYLMSTITSAQAANRDEVIFFFNDHLGSAVAAVSESGELCWSEEYTAYGDKGINDDVFNTTGCGIVGEERGFTGHTEDVNSDLVYMQQRYYDPSIGRFLSIDPREANPNEPMTFNRYAYANNNPYKYTDPDGEFAFLVPVAVFVAKEVVAELASNATGGASDFLSTRRVATKVAAAAAKGLGKLFKKGCSFEPNTPVLTANGYTAIFDIQAGDKVWSMDEITGELSLQPVLQALYADYSHRVEITWSDEETGLETSVVSNKFHPYFVKREAAVESSGNYFKASYNSSESHAPAYQGSTPGGQWIDASELLVGDKLLMLNGRWAKVAKKTISEEHLTAYNIDVANTDTYYVGSWSKDESGAVLVHNCDVPSGSDVPKGADTPHNQVTGGNKTAGAPETNQPNSIHEQTRPDGSRSVTYYDENGRMFSREDYGQLRTHGQLGRGADGRSVPHEHRVDWDPSGRGPIGTWYRELGDRGEPVGSWIKD